jgi:phage repressor protein C with HTH and peptisase S24 domain
MGDSMLPTLTPGTIVLGVWPFRVKVGDTVIIRHAGLDKIKRISGMRGNEIFLVGDNTRRSTDSRDFGWLKHDVIIAKVIWPNRRRTED